MTQNAKKDAAQAEAMLGMGLICSQGPGSPVRLSAWSGLSFAFEEIINDLVFATVARDSAGLGHGHGARRVECRMKEEGGGREVTPLRAGH